MIGYSLMKSLGRNEVGVYPTQKPVALLERIIGHTEGFKRAEGRFVEAGPAALGPRKFKLGRCQLLDCLALVEVMINGFVVLFDFEYWADLHTGTISNGWVLRTRDGCVWDARPALSAALHKVTE